MAAFNKSSLLFCTLLVLCLAASVYSQTRRQGINFCQECGSISDTGFNKSNISRCIVFKRDDKAINQSIFECQCREEFEGNGITCNDKNECLDRKDNNCDNHANCTNTNGSYDCTCRKGYRGTGVVCEEVDECKEAEAKNISLCDGGGTCSNIPGSYKCSCKSGYQPINNATNCGDVNECLTGNGGCDQQCINMVGSSKCSCYVGYEFEDPSNDTSKCKAYSQCERLVNPCGRNAHCVDTDGDYYCECNRGFEWEKGSFQRHCVDVDECERDLHNCSKYSNTDCHNFKGSFDCFCKDGYFGSKDKCNNVDECSGDNECDKNAYCTDTTGNYTCTCNAGYEGDGFTCTDIDECANSTYPCDENAKCTNTISNFTCECIYGYRGNGSYCEVALFNGADLEGRTGEVARSKLIVQVHLLDHQRLDLELEHEKLLRRCAKLSLNKLIDQQRNKKRARREVIAVSKEEASSAQTIVFSLQKIIADLTLENHALRISCPET